MLMVVFIISVLLILTIPNITKHKGGVEDSTCEAYVTMVETQIAAYQLIENKEATMDDLVSKDYIPTNQCSNGQTIIINGDGDAVVNE